MLEAPPEQGWPDRETVKDNRNRIVSGEGEGGRAETSGYVESVEDYQYFCEPEGEIWEAKEDWNGY